MTLSQLQHTKLGLNGKLEINLVQNASRTSNTSLLARMENKVQQLMNLLKSMAPTILKLITPNSKTIQRQSSSKSLLRVVFQ